MKAFVTNINVGVLAILVIVCVCIVITVGVVAGGRPTAAVSPVIGGTAVRRDSFLALAYIIDFRGRGGSQCTGTVVAPRLVLTAGHCAENPVTDAVDPAEGFRVMTDRAHKGALNHEFSRVSQVVVYPGYTRSQDAARPDAALLVLSHAIAAPPLQVANATASRLALTTPADAWFVGWATNYTQQRFPNTILQAKTVLQSSKWCQTELAFRVFHSQYEICAIDRPTYKTGVCDGDSGGPLVVWSASKSDFVQIGVASRSESDSTTHCSTQLPAIFTSVDGISPWLQRWIGVFDRQQASGN